MNIKILILFAIFTLLPIESEDWIYSINKQYKLLWRVTMYFEKPGSLRWIFIENEKKSKPDYGIGYIFDKYYLLTISSFWQIFLFILLYYIIYWQI